MVETQLGTDKGAIPLLLPASFFRRRTLNDSLSYYAKRLQESLLRFGPSRHTRPIFASNALPRISGSNTRKPPNISVSRKALSTDTPANRRLSAASWLVVSNTAVPLSTSSKPASSVQPTDGLHSGV